MFTKSKYVDTINTMSTKLVLNCPICNQSFTKEKKHVNEAIRKGYVTTCSLECQSDLKTKKEEVECKTCNTKFLKKKSQIDRSANHYCSRDCFFEYKRLNKLYQEQQLSE